MAEGLGLFPDPGLLRERIRQEQMAQQAQIAQLFGDKAGQAYVAQQVGGLLGQGLNKLFGLEAQDPRVAQAEKLSEISRKVASQFQGQKFDPASTEQLTVLRDELMKGGFINQAVEVGDMIRSANKTLAETQQKQAAAEQAEATTEKTGEETTEIRRRLAAGGPEADVANVRAGTNERNTQANLNKANEFYIKSLGKGSVIAPLDDQEVLDTSEWLNSKLPEFKTFFGSWTGFGDADRAAMTADVATLAKTKVVRGEAPDLAQARQDALVELQAYVRDGKYNGIQAQNYVLGTATRPNTTANPDPTRTNSGLIFTPTGK